MDRWTCPACQRDFGKPNRSHQCSPGLTIEQYFAAAAPFERPVFEAVAEHLRSLGDVIIDPIAVGILFKHGPVFCELRARKRWVALGFGLRRKLTSSRLSRKVNGYQGKYYHVINVTDPAQIDDEVKAWLTESYWTAMGMMVPADDPTLEPDDIDDPFGS